MVSHEAFGVVRQSYYVNTLTMTRVFCHPMTLLQYPFLLSPVPKIMIVSNKVKESDMNIKRSNFLVRNWLFCVRRIKWHLPRTSKNVKAGKNQLTIFIFRSALKERKTSSSSDQKNKTKQ